MPDWHLHPSVWVILLGVQAGYLLCLRRFGRRHVEPGDPPASGRQIGLFTAGVLTMWVAADWPIHDLSERFLYSAHMVQHVLLTLVAPPMLILGMPDWMLRGILRPVMPVARVILRPFPALVTFNLVLVLTHWPLAVDLSVRSELFHFSAHAVLVGSALVMWWPVVSPLAELPRLSYPGQMLYLFLQSIVPTVPASFLTFGSQPLYHVYETFPRLWGISALTDQRVAGLIMKLVGGFILWGWIAVIFFKWYAREQTSEPDELEWQDVERQLNRTRVGPT
jgi:putative membrane protein